MYIIFVITCVLLFGSRHRVLSKVFWVLSKKVLSKFFFCLVIFWINKFWF